MKAHEVSTSFSLSNNTKNEINLVDFLSHLFEKAMRRGETLKIRRGKRKGTSP